MNNPTIKAIYDDVKSTPARSAWTHGVKLYAFELISHLAEEVPETDLIPEKIDAAMLNGARDWYQYSEGGCACVYDEHIARRLCTPSELKRTYYGAKDPNPRETWLDVQARALFQAAHLIKVAAVKVAKLREEGTTAA